MARISEPDLVLPALYIINQQPGITTGRLINELREIFNPIGEDGEILQGRNDDKFSQIVRNLVSHHTLDKRLRYTILSKAETGNSIHTLSETGLKYLQDNIQSLESLLSNNLGYIDTINGIVEINKSHLTGTNIIVFDENIFINEGRKKTITTQVYERSKLLRNIAIEHYSQNGRIICEVCGFDFYMKYGKIGQGYIEIHHQKPIFQYEESDFSKVVTDALNNLVPLCSNCHRMIHRNKEKPFTIQELKNFLVIHRNTEN
jgi:5-methylcytosine-specific restriction endonuclease McrA